MSDTWMRVDTRCGHLDIRDAWCGVCVSKLHMRATNAVLHAIEATRASWRSVEQKQIEFVAGLMGAIYAWHKWHAVRQAYKDAEQRAHWRSWDWGG